MHRSARASLALLVSSLAVLATAAAPAIANTDLTASTITSPADGTYITSDTIGQTVTITGTAEGTATSTDLRCYYGNLSVPVAIGVNSAAIKPDGTFTKTVPASVFGRDRCLLRAVNLNDTDPMPPGSDPEFAGVQIGAGLFSVNTYAGNVNGPNYLAPTYWTWQHGGATHDVDLFDAGTCGVAPTGAVDPLTLAEGRSIWSCANYFDAGDGGSPSTRSDLQVDGHDAYFARSWFSMPAAFPVDDPQAPSLTIDGHAQDPASGLVHVDETQLPSRCAVAKYPSTAATCAPASRTGVRLERRTETLRGGAVARTTDTWSSTDGQAHQLDLLPAVDQAEPSLFLFPGWADGRDGLGGQSVPLDPSVPARILMSPKAVGTGETGAAVLDPPPAEARFTSDGSWHPHWTVTVPATGSVVLRSDWITAPDHATAQALAAASAETFRPSPPAVDPPAPPHSDPPKSDPPKTGPPSGGPPKRDTTAPILSGVSASPRAFRVRKKTGTKLAWKVNEPARVVFTVRRATAGRKKGKACVAPRQAAKKAKRCTRLTTVMTLKPREQTAGRHSVAFSARVGRKALAAGTYRIEARATDPSGNRSKVRTASFTVRRAAR